MVSKLDESVGAIVKQLDHSKLLHDSLIVFSTDNGGPAAGFNLNAASNWPLRGVKNTLWEGGVRGAGLIWYPYMDKRSRVSDQRMQIADWLPTLLGSFGEHIGNTTSIDGVSIYDSLSNDTPSPREEIFHNYDKIWKTAAVTVGQWKLILGASPYQEQWDGWYGPDGNRTDEAYDIQSVLKSPAGLAIEQMKLMPSIKKIQEMRHSSSLKCPEQRQVECRPILAPCLFNIKADPCEVNNLADDFPEILKKLIRRFDEIKATALEPGNLPLDSRANPKFWNNEWTNYGDFQ